MNLSYDVYRQGIARASQKGLIVNKGCDLFGPDDRWTHLPDKRNGLGNGMLSWENTQPLTSFVRAVLSFYKENDPLHILELGPGAGLALHEAALVFPSAHLASASLSPLNPSSLLKKGIDDILHDLSFLVEHSTSAHKISDAEKQEKIDYLHKRVSLDFVLSFAGNHTLDDGTVKLFDPFTVSDKPLVERQYIGVYVDMLPCDDKRYQIVYAQSGSFLECNKGVPLQGQQEKIAAAYRLLTDDGVLILTPGPSADISLMTLKDSLSQAVVIYGMKSSLNGVCIAKDESPLALASRKDSSLFVQRRDGYVEMGL